MKRQAMPPTATSSAAAERWPEFPYLRPDFPGDPPTAAPRPRPLTELLEDVANHCEWSTDPQHGLAPVGSTFWLCQAAFVLLDELAARAWAGDRMAAVRLFDLGRETSRLLLSAYRERLPGVIERARMLPEVPGSISRSREAMEDWARLMDEIGQGDKSPAILVARPKNRGWNPRHPKARLVAALYEYMLETRRKLLLWPFPISHPRLLEIRSLPDLAATPETWKSWCAVAWRIVKDWTAGDPAAHEIFNRPPLAELNALADPSKSRLSSAHREAWHRFATDFPAKS